MAMTKEEQEEYEKQVAEFLEKGGKIIKCDTGATTEGAVTSVWKKKGPGRPKSTDKKEV